MGAKLSISLWNDNKEEEMRKVLLVLAKDRFNEFRDAVLLDDRLKDKFRQITNNQEGDFFTNPFAAVGYLKNEVFQSEQRTKLVYTHVQDYYSKNPSEWDEPVSSDSDEDQTQETSSASDCQDNQRVVRRPKVVPQSFESSTLSLQAQIRHLNEEIQRLNGENKLNQQVKEALKNQDQNELKKEINYFKDKNKDLESKLKEKDYLIEKYQAEARQAQEEKYNEIQKREDVQNYTEESFQQEREKLKNQSKEIAELKSKVSAQDRIIKSLEGDAEKIKIRWEIFIKDEQKLAYDSGAKRSNLHEAIFACLQDQKQRIQTESTEISQLRVEIRALKDDNQSTNFALKNQSKNEMTLTKEIKFFREKLQILERQIQEKEITINDQLKKIKQAETNQTLAEEKLKLEREKSEKKALESFELVSKVSACEKIIERLEGDASKMKKNWDSFLQDDQERTQKNGTQIRSLHEEIFACLHDQRKSFQQNISKISELKIEITDLQDENFRIENEMQNHLKQFNLKDQDQNKLLKENALLKEKNQQLESFFEEKESIIRKQVALVNQGEEDSKNQLLKAEKEKNEIEETLSQEREKCKKQSKAIQLLQEKVTPLDENIKRLEGDASIMKTKWDEFLGDEEDHSCTKGANLHEQIFACLYDQRKILKSNKTEIQKLRDENQKIKNEKESNEQKHPTPKDEDQNILIKENASLKAENQQLQSELQEKEKIIGTQNSKLKQIEEERNNQSKKVEIEKKKTEENFNQEREKSTQKQLEIQDLKEKVNSCDQNIKKLEIDASKMKNKWENFLQGEEDNSQNQGALLHEQIFNKLDFQRTYIKKLMKQIKELQEESQSCKRQADQKQQQINSLEQLANNLSQNQQTKSQISRSYESDPLATKFINFILSQTKSQDEYVKANQYLQNETIVLNKQHQDLIDQLSSMIKLFEQEWHFASIEDIKGKLNKKYGHLNSLAEQFFNLQKTKMTEFMQKNQSNEKLRSECKNLTSQLTGAQKEYEHKKQEVDEITKAINGLSNKWNQQYNQKLTKIDETYGDNWVNGQFSQVEVVKNFISLQKMQMAMVNNLKVQLETIEINHQFKEGNKKMQINEENVSEDVPDGAQQTITSAFINKANALMKNQANIGTKIKYLDSIQNNKQKQEQIPNQLRSQKTQLIKNNQQESKDSDPHISRSKEEKQEQNKQIKFIQYDRIQSNEDEYNLKQKELIKKADEEGKFKEDQLLKQDFLNRQNVKSQAAEKSNDFQLQHFDRQPVVEFALITEDFYRLKLGNVYQNANLLAHKASQNMMENTRSLKKYSKVTIQILGFHQDEGKIFYGLIKPYSQFSLNRITCQLGKKELDWLNFLEDYIQIMQKHEHIIFKCPYDTLEKDIAKKNGVTAGQFVYFYIFLEDAQEIFNPEISSKVYRQDEESQAKQFNEFQSMKQRGSSAANNPLPKSLVNEQMINGQMHLSEQKSVVEFTLLVQKHAPRLIYERQYPNAQSIISYVAREMQKNNRALRKYSYVTIQLLGFYQSGSIFFGHKVGSFYQLKEITYQLGKNTVIMYNQCTPFIEDYIQLMQKDEHVVFKCPYDTLGKEIADLIALKAGSFVYFYIYLKEAQENANPRISASVVVQGQEEIDQIKDRAVKQRGNSAVNQKTRDNLINEQSRQTKLAEILEKNKANVPQMEFVLIERRKQLDCSQKYSNMNDLSLIVKKGLKNQPFTLYNYPEATYYILGFYKDGQIFYGDETINNLGYPCFNFYKKTNVIGQGKVTFFGQKAPIIEEFIRSMKKGDATVFKCSIGQLNQIGFESDQSAYLYIHLLETEKVVKPIAPKLKVQPRVASNKPNFPTKH